ncbi:MAG: IS66 family transposase [Planctomycetota bacterium]
MLNHWRKLMLFPREAGAPLDNNIRERAPKKIILHRQNSYFFVTHNGARVADLYTSLIHAREVNGISAFDYLTELELHAEERAERPEEWMPWNDEATLDRVNAGPPCPVRLTLSTSADCAATPNRPR